MTIHQYSQSSHFYAPQIAVPSGIADDISELAEKFGLNCSFPVDLERRAEIVASRGLDHSNGPKRVDLRGLPFVTIDGIDAKDYDDAVHCRADRDGFELNVAVADVSHYVKEGDALDLEAAKRGNSVYFPGLVLPMLPAALSENLCSLKPGEDRLCLGCKISFDRDGSVRAWDFREGLMCSRRRLTYQQADGLLADPDQDLDVCSSLLALAELCAKLKAKRAFHGALTIEVPEIETAISNGVLTRLVLGERLTTQSIIEECMVAVNVCAAKLLRKRDVVFLQRVHCKPKRERADSLRALLRTRGIVVGDLNLPQKMQDVIDAVTKIGDLSALALGYFILRTLSRASYAPVGKGHYGLGLALYAHTTSPIRRYPDLLIHRQIKNILNGLDQTPAQVAKIASLGEHCTATEMNAERASRDLMGRIVGRMQVGRKGIIDGVITGMASCGLFVILDQMATGMLPLSELRDDFYRIDRHGIEIVGQKRRRVYRIGDPIRVTVAKVNRQNGQCRLKLADG